MAAAVAAAVEIEPGAAVVVAVGADTGGTDLDLESNRYVSEGRLWADAQIDAFRPLDPIFLYLYVFSVFSALCKILYDNAGVRATFERCDELISRPFKQASAASRAASFGPAASLQRELRGRKRQTNGHSKGEREMQASSALQTPL